MARLKLIILSFRAFLPVALFLGGPTTAHALDDLQGWFQFITQKRLGDTPFTAQLELQPRYSDDQKTFNLNLIRPSLNYQASKHIAIALGYLQLRDEDLIERESRIWGQTTHRLQLEELSFASRLRVESRRWSDTSGDSDGWRARFQTRLTFDGALDPFSPFITDEIFYELDALPSRSVGGLNQNRLFLGVSTKLNDAFTAEISAFHVNQVRDQPQSDLNAFGLLIAILHTW
ncbi:MAG: DUF2490 domain-containing protein [Deltaproteobacteria bacterium]|nr:DUF2490 domain-containing protein [Deltaproteobacteria bacterium]